MNRTDKSKRLDMARLHFEEFYENFYNALLENGKFQKGSELGMHALCNSLVWAWNIHIAYGVTEGKDNVSKMPISLNPDTSLDITPYRWHVKLTARAMHRQQRSQNSTCRSSSRQPTGAEKSAKSALFCLKK